MYVILYFNNYIYYKQIFPFRAYIVVIIIGIPMANLNFLYVFTWKYKILVVQIGKLVWAIIIYRKKLWIENQKIQHNIVWSKCINTIYVESCLNQIPTPYLKLNGLK